ncbi:hypothetical protein H4217_008274, partial [Coemansia sp. RSA 1939]
MHQWYADWERSGRGAALLPPTEGSSAFCTVSKELLDLRVPMDSVLRPQQKLSTEHHQQQTLSGTQVHYYNPPVTTASHSQQPSASVSAATLSVRTIRPPTPAASDFIKRPPQHSLPTPIYDDGDDDFQDFPSHRVAPKIPHRATATTPAVLHTAVSAQSPIVEIADDSEEILRSFEIPEDLPGMGDKMSVSPREVELVDNMDDPYEICDLDDFDVDELQGFVDESQRLDNARSASNNSNDSGQGNGVSNLTSANATLAIDLCSDIDEDQVIDINDLDDFDDVGGTTLATSFSPKRF